MMAIYKDFTVSYLPSTLPTATIDFSLAVFDSRVVLAGKVVA